MLKKLLAFTVIGCVSLSAPAAHALTLMDSSFEDVVGNVANADSVDGHFSIDVMTKHAEIDRPMELHLDIDGATDFTDNGAFDMVFWTTDEDGAYQEANGSLVMTPDTVYLSEDGDDWYFIEKAVTSYVPDADAADEAVDAFTAFMQEAFDRGIITADADGVDMIDGKMTVRYAYEVNTEHFVEYLEEENVLSADEADEARASFVDNVTIDGSLWVDTAEMLPVMFTLNVSAHPSATSYTTVEFSMFFESWNERVDVDEPDNAVSFDDYRSGETEDMVMSSIEHTVANMDTDGDGLMDEDETSTWGSNPLRADTDADGYDDDTEVVNGYNPNGSGKLDSDGDGLTDYNEMTIHWTDRFDADSDNDGYNDGLEIANGYDPNGPGRW